MLIPKNERRIFLAVNVPPETVLLLEGLKKANLYCPDIKWMRDHNLHLTIFFIGNIECSDYSNIVNICRTCVAKFAPFRLEFDGLKFMPSLRPRMLWARYRIQDQFTSLYHHLHEKLKPYLHATSGIYEQPVPHITIARFGNLKQTPIVNLTEGGLLPDIYIDKVFIWETENSNGPSNYIQNLEGFNLSGDISAE